MSWIITGLLVYLVVGLGIVYFVPRRIVPIGSSVTPESSIKVRNDVRETVLKAVGAVGVVGSFLFGVLQFTSEENFKSRQQAATMLSNAIAQLGGREEVQSQSSDRAIVAAGAIVTMGLVAKQTTDSAYYLAVYETLANYVRAKSSSACKDWEKSTYVPRPDMQAAFRVFGERDDPNHITGRIFNLDHSCAVDVDVSEDKNRWGKIKGLAGVRLAGARLHRVDFTRAYLVGTDFRGVAASDWENDNWAEEVETKKYNLHDKDANEDLIHKYLRRKYIAHFIDANLSNANFEGAQLAGADFTGANLINTNFAQANISRANFRGAYASENSAESARLMAEKLLAACIWRKDQPQRRAAAEPILWPAVLKALEATKKQIPLCSV